MLDCAEYWESELDNLKNLEVKRTLIDFEIENLIYTENLEKENVLWKK